MKEQRHYAKQFFELVFIVCLSGIFVEPAPAQVQTEPLPIIYMHGGGGFAGSWLTSSDIDALLEDDFGIESIGGPVSWSVNAGIRNIVQVEYRRGDAGHSIIKNGLVSDGGFNGTGLGTIAEIAMDYDFEDRLIKFNPFFLKTSTKSGVHLAYFIIFGKGKVTYKDETGFGFGGNSRIYGFELSVIRRFITAGVSIKKYAINFNSIILDKARFKLPALSELDASQIQIQLNLAVGLGI